MKITLLQTDIIWNNPEKNIQKANHLISSQPKSDLYVLPEMWSTGFVTKPFDVAEKDSSSVSLEWMKSTALQYHCAICGSLAIYENCQNSLNAKLKCNELVKFRNRHYFVDGRSGNVSYYDKHHLFSYGHEDLYFEKGKKQTVVEYMGFRILLLTCYDLRFPIWSRYNDELNYDMIICVANWPETRQNALQILSRARAIENQSYLIICNRVGSDKHNHYLGNSAVINPNGKTICKCLQNVESAFTCEIDHEIINNIRSHFCVLNDRDYI